MEATKEFALTSLVFIIYNNEIRSGKILRIIIDHTGTNYVIPVDGNMVERPAKEMGKSREELFNKLVDKYIARRNK